MHETSLLYDLLRTVEASARENNIEEVTEIKLVVGGFSNVLPDALEFAFDSFKGQPPLAEDARLVLEIRMPEAACSSCGKSYGWTPEDEYTCRFCGSLDLKLTGGEDLFIEYYKGRERS